MGTRQPNPDGLVEPERDICHAPDKVPTDRTSRDRIIEELTVIAFADIRDFYTAGPEGMTVRPPDELPPALRRTVKSVTVTHTAQGAKVRLTLHDKRGALNLLRRMLGLNERPSLSDILVRMRDTARAKRLAAILYRALKAEITNETEG